MIIAILRQHGTILQKPILVKHHANHAKIILSVFSCTYDRLMNLYKVFLDNLRGVFSIFVRDGFLRIDVFIIEICFT